VTQARTVKVRIAALTALGASLLAAALPAIVSSPIVAGWVWIR
jgi:hypothetical protein